MPLTMQELAGFGALGANPVAETARVSKPAIDRYVACVKKAGRAGLQRAFYVQDPRQEEVTQAHRAQDPCYTNLNDAIYASMKVLAKYHLGHSRMSDAEVEGVFAAYKANRGFQLGKQKLDAFNVRSLVEEAVSGVELDAQTQASERVGLVLADEGESPLKIGYTEWKRRTDEQVKKVKAGTLKRAPLKDEDVVSPEEQKRRAAEAARRAALQRARTGPLVSCPRNVPYEVCLRDYERRRLAAQPKKKINPFLVVGLGLTGLLLIVAASRAGR
jgi:hypothetical protein